MKKLVLYNYFRSSASYRVRIALNFKNLEYEYIPIHLLKNGGEQNTAEYRALNPSGEVPCLIHEGKALAQSMAILDYLDHVFPNPPLWPKSFYDRAVVLQICEMINSGIQPLQNLKTLATLETRLGATPEAKTAWAAHWISLGLAALERLLTVTAKDFCFGNQVTAADMFLIPQLFTARRYKVELAQYSNISRIEKKCLSLDAFIKADPLKQIDFE